MTNKEGKSILVGYTMKPLCHADVRKDTRLPLLFHPASDGKLAGAWEWGLLLRLVELPKWTKCTKMTNKSMYVGCTIKPRVSMNGLGAPLGTKLHMFIMGNVLRCILIIPYTLFVQIMSCWREKRYQAPLLFHPASDGKLGGAWERRYVCTIVLWH